MSSIFIMKPDYNRGLLFISISTDFLRVGGDKNEKKKNQKPQKRQKAFRSNKRYSEKVTGDERR